MQHAGDRLAASWDSETLEYAVRPERKWFEVGDCVWQPRQRRASLTRLRQNNDFPTVLALSPLGNILLVGFNNEPAELYVGGSFQGSIDLTGIKRWCPVTFHPSQPIVAIVGGMEKRALHVWT